MNEWMNLIWRTYFGVGLKEALLSDDPLGGGLCCPGNVLYALVKYTATRFLGYY